MSAELEERIASIERELEELREQQDGPTLGQLMDRGLTRRQALYAMGLMAGGAAVGAATREAAVDPVLASHGGGQIATEEDPLEEIHVENWFSDEDHLDVESITNDNYVEPQVTASAGTSYDADLTQANYHKVTMTGDVTFDFIGVDASAVNSLVLHLVQDGTGGWMPSFTPTVVWDGGSAPSWSTGANEEDIVTFVHDQDGSQWIGFVGGLTLG